MRNITVENLDYVRELEHEDMANVTGGFMGVAGNLAIGFTALYASLSMETKSKYDSELKEEEEEMRKNARPLPGHSV
jgi:hypothetical protein